MVTDLEFGRKRIQNENDSRRGSDPELALKRERDKGSDKR